MVFKSGKKYFYGGLIQPYGDISIEALDKILDIIDDYIYLLESYSEYESKIEGRSYSNGNI